MNVVFLVGNGFDLNLGLRTTFSHFINKYCQPLERDSKVIEEFKKTIDQNKKSWGDAEREFGRSTNDFVKLGRNADDFYECYEDFCNQLSQYLQSQEKKIDINKQADKVIAGFSGAINPSKILKPYTEVQRNALLQSIDHISGQFQYSFIDFNYTGTLDACFNLLRSNSGVLGKRTFAGTTYQNTVGQLIHVHGTTTSNMVLGVNDESQIEGIALFQGYGPEYLAQLIKVRTNEMLEENTDAKAASLIQSAELIYIYGMSLGETDKLWWDRILVRMIQNPMVHVIIHCHSAPPRTLIARPYVTWETEKKASFISNLHAEIDKPTKDALLARIHLDTNNIFASMKEIEVSNLSADDIIDAVVGV